MRHTKGLYLPPQLSFTDMVRLLPWLDPVRHGNTRLVDACALSEGWEAMDKDCSAVTSWC